MVNRVPLHASVFHENDMKTDMKHDSCFIPLVALSGEAPEAALIAIA
jgi:hypothetical protein